jgi:hypothetical protein
MKKIKLGKDALTLSILTLVTVLTWIGFDVYKALTKSEIPRVLQKQIAPLNPKVDWEIIEELRNKKTVSEEELKTVVIPEVSPSPEPSPAVTPSPEVIPEEEATESGTENI